MFFIVYSTDHPNGKNQWASDESTYTNLLLFSLSIYSTH